MATTHTGDFAYQPGRSASGPAFAFAAVALAVLAIAATAAQTLSPDAVLPVISSALFGLAGLVALVAWQRGSDQQRARPNYWDIAGLLTFVGICVAALIDPDQMVRLIETQNRPR